MAFDITDMKKKEDELLEQAEMMSLQEEMVRQNLLEYETLLKENKKNTKKLSQVINAVNSSFFVFELSTEAKIVDANHNFLDFFKISKEELLNTELKKISRFLNTELTFDDFWKKILESKSNKALLEVEINNIETQFIIVHIPIKEKGKIVKVTIWATEKNN